MLKPMCTYFNDSVKKPCNSYIKGGFCSRPDQFRCIEYVRRNEPVLSYSSIKDFTQCHRKYYFSNILGIERIEKPKRLQLGSLADAILRILHSRNVTDPISEYSKLIDSKIEESMNPEDIYNSVGDIDLWQMKVAFDAYIRLGFHELKGEVQYAFKYDEIGLPKVHGFIDMLCYDGNIGYEFKYTENQDYYSELWNIHDQIITYFLGVPSIKSFKLFCITPPHMRFKKNETITELYNRTLESVLNSQSSHFKSFTFWREEFDYNAYIERLRVIVSEIVSCVERGPNSFYCNPYICYHINCEYIDACRHNIIPENLYVKKEIKDENLW